jgi:transposase
MEGSMHEAESQDTKTLWVPMLDPEIVKQLRALAALGWGKKRIARELGIARNSVKRYLREGESAETQTRPGAWTLDADQQTTARSLLDGPAAGNTVVVKRLLAQQDVDVPLRTLQRVLAPHRQAKRTAELATVRFETAPGHQMQIDFGEKWVSVGGVRTRVFFFVAVLGYSRRIFVRASLSQRQDDWREGLAGAFRTFGGVTQRILIDRAGALVVGEDRETGTARIHPAFAAFCKDWGVEVSACRPYRARTKGKTESGVGYVKRNAIAGIAFTNFAALEAHLATWMLEADRRIHGTTHERPTERFERDEKQTLRPLPSPVMPVRVRRLSRRVATDCFVDVDTIRYSVPHELVKRYVEVLVGDLDVVVFHGGVEVARHSRHHEPHQRVSDSRHFEGIFRQRDDAAIVASSPIGRSLAVYADAVGGAA